MTYRLRGVLACALVGALSVGCTSTRTVAGPTRTVTATVVHTVAPKPTTWTIAVARAHYLALVKPGNARLDKFQKDIRRHPSDLKLLKKDCGALAKSDDAFLRGLAAGHWPAQTLPAVHSLETGVAKERGGYSESSAATDFNDFNSIKVYDPSGYAEQVRVSLGLPGN